jgi:hypothetical protein
MLSKMPCCTDLSPDEGQPFPGEADGRTPGPADHSATRNLCVSNPNHELSLSRSALRRLA